MGIIGRINDPADSVIGSKIKVINFQEEEGIVATYFSYRLYTLGIYTDIQDNLKQKFRQTLISLISWEDQLALDEGLPPGTLRGLYLISGERKDIVAIAKAPSCKAALQDPSSYIQLDIGTDRVCRKAVIRIPKATGITEVLDLLMISKIKAD